MQTVTDVFKELIADRKGFRPIYRVKLRRRFFDSASPSGFVLETVPLVFDQDEILGISPLQRKLDTRQQNKILASNVTLRMRNERNKWVETNITDGIFRGDAAQPAGYDPFRSEFVIEYGVRIPGSPDDTEELIAMFTGEATSYRFDTNKREAEISIRGFEIKMQNADAQNVNTQLTDRPTTPAVGDGVIKEFLGEESVFDMQKVRVAAVEIAQGSRYKIEDENDAEKKVKITIDPAPLGGSPAEAVDYTARQWKKNISVSDVIGLLCDEAGILSADRDIEEPDFPATAQFIEFEDAADFDLATLVRSETESRNGFLSMGDSIPGRKFDTQSDVDDNYGLGAGSHVVIPNQVRIQITQALGGLAGFRLKVGSNSTDFAAVGSLTRVTVTAPASGGPHTVSFHILDGTIEITSMQVKAGLRKVQDNARVSVDYQESVSFPIPPNPPTVTLRLENPRAIPDAASSSSWESDARDLLSAPATFGKLVRVEGLNGGSILWETATADLVGGPFDAFVAIDGSDNIQSTPRQFIKVRATFTPNGARTDGPDVDNITINFTSSTLFIGHADFKGKTVFRAVGRVAEITDMEFVFNGPGKFFFRNKPATPVSILTMDQSHFIQAIKAMNAGYDRVLTTAQVSYGPYYSEKNSITEAEAEPTSLQRFGRKIRVLTINDFLFANNANFADAIAEIIFTNNFKPKRRVQFVSKIVPYLEISDVVTISFFDSELIADTIFGDLLQLEPSFGKNTNVIVREMLAKVVGLSFNLPKHTCTIDVEEVLTA